MPRANRQNQPMWVLTGDPETVNEPTEYAPGQRGSIVTVTEPTGSTPGIEAGRNKSYRYIKTDSTMTVAPFPGAVAWWSNTAQYLTTTSPTALGRGRVAGVYQNFITPGNFGFIQVKGPATVKFIDAVTSAPTAAGLIVIPSATAGKADCLGAGSAATYPALGVSASAYDVINTTAIVELDVPDTVD